METPLRILIDSYIATVQTEGKSKRTTDWYRDKLNDFAEFASNGQPATIGNVTLESARSFVASLQARDCRFVNHPNRPQVPGGLTRTRFTVTCGR